MLAAAMMLDHMGELDRAQRVRDAVRDTIRLDQVVGEKGDKVFGRYSWYNPDEHLQ